MAKKWLIVVSVLLLLIANLAFAKDISEANISSIHTALKKHEITCEQLVSAYIDRIKKYNLSVEKKPPINAIAKINVNALEQARQLDQAFSKNEFKGSLYCIPVLLKDNIDSYDSTSASGSLAMLGNQPMRDAFITEKLRKAGAIILGKGTMDEFASGVFGISGENGRTGNVYDTTKNPGGSSGGSAAAVSANFTMVAIGTDNSGSVRIPAAFNGVVGLRPSTGLISQRGILPRGNMDGTAGPLARTVEDLALVLDVISMPHSKPYIGYLDPHSLKGKRIGIIRQIGSLETFNMLKDTQEVFQNFLKQMQAFGVTIVPNIKLSEFNLDRKLNEAGEREDMNAYLASYPAAQKNYRDICESDRTRVWGNTKECLKFVANLPPKFGTKYNDTLKVFKKNKIYVEKIMDKYHLDALLIPVSTTGSATYNVKAIMNEFVASNAGVPGITFPIGYTKADHMPVGVELIGRQFAEGTLLGMAYAYEKNSPPRVPPTMPEPNLALEKMDIPSYNNLLIKMGFDAYQTILIKSKPGEFSKDLTPDKFRKIVSEELNRVDDKN